MQTTLRRNPPLSYLAALVLAVPVGALIWFELIYLAFGLTGDDATTWVNGLSAVVAFGLALGWPLHGTARPAQVVQRGCRLGSKVALLLPVVTIAVLLIWENADNRPDLGMGGLMLYSMPVVALGLTVVLVIGFSIGERLAAKRLHEGTTMPLA